jgi:hypothetical protein
MESGYHMAPFESADGGDLAIGQVVSSPGQDLENPLDNWLLKRSADGFFALKETV